MQAAAGREPGSWTGRAQRAAGRQALRRERGGDGAQNTSLEENVFGGDTTTTSLPPEELAAPREGCPVFLLSIQEGTWGPSGFKRNRSHCSPVPLRQLSQRHHSHTLTSGLVVRQSRFNFIYFLLMAKAGQQLLQG